MAPLLRTPWIHGMYADEASPAGLKAPAGQGSGPSFTVNKYTASAVPGKNPLFASPDSSPKFTAQNDVAGNYFIFVPPAVVQNCLTAAAQQATPPPLKITLFFSPFSVNLELFTFGLRAIFDYRANDQRVLISVPGNEDAGNWGIGISMTEIKSLLAHANAGYSAPQVSVLAAWSNGYKGMVATLRAIGRVSDLPDLGKVEKVIFYDCLYFTGGSQGLVDDGLSKLGRVSTTGAVQLVAYLVTTGGNDSLNPADVLRGIPFIKNNNLGAGLIPIVGSNRDTMRKIVLVRSLAWALQEGAITQNDLTPGLVQACAVIAATKRNTVRSLPSLPFGKAVPAGSVDLQTFARMSQNAPIQMLSTTDAAKALALVRAGEMIFHFFPVSDVDHMVLMPELAWEFISG